jgi:hypothetical protein
VWILNTKQIKMPKRAAAKWAIPIRVVAAGTKLQKY